MNVHHMMEKFSRLFNKIPAIIGMIHVPALPGTPASMNNVQMILDRVKKETEIYLSSGVDGVMIENMHDTPYLNRKVGPEIVSTMTVAAIAMKSIVGNDIPSGIQILSGCNQEALAVAKSANLNFVRAEGFVFAHVADEGIMESDAGPLLRYQKMIAGDDILIWTDIKKKHSSHAITSDLSIEEVAKAAEFFRSDGLIVTGNATGEEANISEVNKVIHISDIPVIVGSGITKENFSQYKQVHAMIVGSYFKNGGSWKNNVNNESVSNFMKYVDEQRNLMC